MTSWIRRPVLPLGRLLSGFVAAACIALLSLPATGFSQLTPAGDSFIVNTYTTGDQWIGGHAGNAIVTDPNGGFLLVWGSVDQDGDQSGVFAQRLDHEAARVGGEFQVNTYTTGNQGASVRPDLIEVAADFASNGSFVVVWSSEGQDSQGAFGERSDIFGQRFDSQGARVASEFQVNTYTTGSQRSPEIAIGSGGQALVVWTSDGADGDESGIAARRYDASGIAIGAEFLVNTVTEYQQSLPAVAAAGENDFLVVWSSRQAEESASEYNVAAQRLNSSGAPLGGEFTVNTYTSGRNWFPAVAADATGRFAVSWSSGNDSALRVFTSTGTPATAPIMVADSGMAGIARARLAMNDDGVTTAAWTENFEDVRLRRFDSVGSALGSSILVNEQVARVFGAQVATSPSGSAVVIWAADRVVEGVDFDGDGAGMVARRVCDDTDASCKICPEFDDAIDDDHDGIPNGCDPCTLLDPAQEFLTAKVSVKFKGFASKNIPTKGNQLSVKGDLILSGVLADFGALDPLSDGLRIQVDSSTGSHIAAATIAPGPYSGAGSRGWRLNGAGNKWGFLDRTDEPAAGFSRVNIKDVSRPGLPKIRFQAKAKGGTYPTGDAFLPLHVRIMFGPQTLADAGGCALATFETDECRASNDSMKCGH